MPVESLTQFLEENEIDYTVIRHDRAFTAQEVAAAARISGKRLAKAVMLVVDGKMVMAVLPATHKVGLERIQEHIGADDVKLATEAEFKGLLPDCESGALPPFGNLYGIKVFADQALSQEVEIAFCGGSHDELIRLSFPDFERLAQPEVFSFAFLEI